VGEPGRDPAVRCSYARSPAPSQCRRSPDSGLPAGRQRTEFRTGESCSMAPCSLCGGGVLRSHHRHAIDLDVERSGPFGYADKNARGRVFGEIAGVDRVDGCEVFLPGYGRCCTSSRSAARFPPSPGTASSVPGSVRSGARSAPARSRRSPDRTAASRKHRLTRPPRVTGEIGAFHFASQDEIGSTRIASRFITAPSIWNEPGRKYHVRVMPCFGRRGSLHASAKGVSSAGGRWR
jgi:hypothetical protein